MHNELLNKQPRCQIERVFISGSLPVSLGILMPYSLDFPVAHYGIRTMIISGFNILNGDIC